MLRFLGTIIVLACILGSAYMFFYFDSKLKSYKRQLLAANNQMLKSQSKSTSSETLKTQSNIPKEIHIVYNTPTYKYGITQPYTAVYLAPLENSYIINKLKDKLQVEILYEAEINKEIWFFISLELNTNVNSKGWVRKPQLSMYIDENTTACNITTMSYR